MGKVTFQHETVVDAPLDQVWSFFSKVTNLPKLTSFPQVLIETDTELKVDERIEMTLSFLFVKVRWVARFEEVRPFHSFIDRAIVVPFPFKTWVHEHQFYEKDQQTIIKDIVELDAYLPSFLVNKILFLMFLQRKKKLLALFDNVNT